jgi:hypothetical protein
MNENQSILDLVRGKISREAFSSIFPNTLTKKCFFNRIKKSILNKNSDDLEYTILLLGYISNINYIDYSLTFRELVLEKWHNQHEILVDLLSETIDVNNIETFYNVILTKYNRPWDEGVESLAIKCIWALKAINTKESWGKIKLLSKSENEIIRESALERLEQIND